MKRGWEVVPLGQICSIKSGKSDTKDAVEDGVYAFFDRSRTIKKSSRYLFDCEALIVPGEGTEFLPKYFVGKFDLHQRAYALFDFSDRIDVKFLYYYMHHLRDYFPRVAVGATVKSLRLRHFEQLPVSLTALAEQRRIVSVLDEVFEGIATAKAHTEQNLHNARALFESELDSIFTECGLGWVKSTLGGVCQFIGGSQPPKSVFSKTKKNDSIRLIQIRDYKSDNHIVYIPRVLARRFCNADDVMIGRYRHFSDPEWDGEPLEPERCSDCGAYPCVCVKTPAVPCADCGRRPCECPEEACEICGQRPCICKKKVRVSLGKGKAREIDDMMVTTFWHPDGTPMSAQQFMELLFGKLPDFFKDEAELRAVWSVPDTRKLLLHGLAEKGFGHEQLVEMQKIIHAEKSDLFDVLAYVAYALPPLSRQERAARAKLAIDGRFNSKQQAFLDFVLAHYVGEGVEELDQEKLTPLLRLKYHSITDALADLGQPEEIGQVFAGFQRYLYEPQPMHDGPTA